MDQTLKEKMKELEKALVTLQEALEAEEKDTFLRDAAVKRFEYCFELVWKTAKEFLSVQYGDAVFSPKECFRALGKNQLFSSTEVEELLKMVDDRNESTHAYDEDFIEKLYKKIPGYYSLMEKVFLIIEKIV